MARTDLTALMVKTVPMGSTARMVGKAGRDPRVLRVLRVAKARKVSLVLLVRRVVKGQRVTAAL